MKFIDKKGRLFEKIHVFDVVIILLVLVVAVSAYGKLSADSIISFDNSTEVDMVYTLESYTYRADYFENLQVGDQIAEDKKYLDGEIINIEIIDVETTTVDNNGDTITDIHPYYKKAIVTVAATVDYSNPIYQFGNQELREGASMFLTTEKCYLSTFIVGMEVVE